MSGQKISHTLQLKLNFIVTLGESSQTDHFIKNEMKKKFRQL